ncbi:MAG: hypothetical protein MI919_36805, partial [Holophagales bacterium]|nr:hypothetical protein [Holophagales bacterium]
MMPHARSRRLASVRALAALALPGLVLLGWAGCAGEAGPELPEGTWAYGEAAAVEPWLRGLLAFEGSPAAEVAARSLEALEGCERFAAHLPAPAVAAGGLVASLRCADSDTATPELGEPEAVARLRGEALWILGWSLDGAGELAVVRGFRAEEGRLRLSLELPSHLGDGALGLVMPAASDSGRPLLPPQGLEAAGVLIHLRMRADRGLDPASWVPPGSAADRLFGLRGRL